MLALVADRALVVDGVLEIGAGATIAANTIATLPSGGGGGGARTFGAAGANATTEAGAANGAAATTNPSMLTILTAGTAPGSPSLFAVGAGGWATLISCRDVVAVPGIIDANGGGGIGGHHDFFNTPYPATGGGSGGTVVLQGMRVDVTGEFWANGGGGGGGYHGSDAFSNWGQRGQRSTTPARGGDAINGGGAGGSGGTGMASPSPGKPRTVESTLTSGGGGGGSAGFLLAYSPSNTPPTVNTPRTSPNVVVGTLPTN